MTEAARGARTMTAPLRRADSTVRRELGLQRGGNHSGRVDGSGIMVGFPVARWNGVLEKVMESVKKPDIEGTPGAWRRSLSGCRSARPACPSGIQPGKDGIRFHSVE